MKSNLLAILFLLAVTIVKSQVFDITTYGAVGDGNKINTSQIQAAIDACNSAGGGTVLVPPGKFRTGTISLKSNVTLEINGSIQGSTSLSNYPDMPNPVPSMKSKQKTIIYALNAQNIKIIGTGEIDGNGGDFTFLLPQNDDKRPFGLRFISCQNIEVRGIKMVNSAFWMQHYLNCDDIIIDGLYVKSLVNQNNDGINIDCCRNVSITNCTVDTDDDAIVLKSTADIICENVTIKNCTLASNSHTFKLGTESYGGFRNVSISNCVFKKCSEYAPWHVTQDIKGGLNLASVDGALMENITVSDISMTGVRTPIFIRLGDLHRAPTGLPAKSPGTIKNIVIRNITANAISNTTSSVTGIPGYRPEQIKLENINISIPGGESANSGHKVPEEIGETPKPGMFGDYLPSQGLYVRHVEDICIDNFCVTASSNDSRPAIIYDDVIPLPNTIISNPAAKKQCISTIADDAGIEAVNQPGTGVLCATTIAPEVVLKNYGAYTLNAANIHYQIDNGAVKIYNWSGALAAGTTATISLPASSVSGGNHTLKVYTNLPAPGCGDKDASNDQQIKTFTISAPDAGVSTIQNPASSICSLSFQPKVTIKNYGQEPLTVVQVKYRIDNKSQKTYNWSGTINPGSSSTITLPAEPVTAGQHKFSAFTVNPNQCNDINNNNNSFSSTFIASQNNDAGIVLVNRPFKKTCGNKIIPQVTIHNFSSDTLYEATISYRIDKGVWQHQNWTGRVAPGDIKWAVYLPSATLSSYGNHTLECHSSIPNRCSDVNPLNDSIVYSFINVDAPGNTDASPVNISFGKDTVQLSFTPVVQLKNFGQPALTSATISYRMDQGSWVSTSWAGNLASQVQTAINLPVLSATPGIHTFTVVTDLPNDCIDTKPVNDTIVKTFLVAKHDASLISLLNPVGILNSDSVYPQVSLKNNSNIPLNYIELVYVLDNQPPVSQIFSTSGSGLPTGASINLTLNGTKVNSGNHTFSIYSRNPNVYPDFYPADDTLKSNFSVVTTSLENHHRNPTDELVIYPNPTTGVFTVHYPVQENNNINIRIVNLLGEPVFQQSFNALPETVSFSLANHPVGIYFLEIGNQHHKIIKKIILTNR